MKCDVVRFGAKVLEREGRIVSSRSFVCGHGRALVSKVSDGAETYCLTVVEQVAADDPLCDVSEETALRVRALGVEFARRYGAPQERVTLEVLRVIPDEAGACFAYREVIAF